MRGLVELILGVVLIMWLLANIGDIMQLLDKALALLMRTVS